MKLFLFFLGIILFPFYWAVSITTIHLIQSFSSTGNWLAPSYFWMGIGFFAWLLFWLFLPHPVRAYVLGHELTHAIWGLLFGAKIGKLKVTVTGGSVVLNKSNLLITLAPYFFPFYTFLLLFIQWIVSLFVSPIPWPWCWHFFLGFTWSFHICFTLQSLFTVAQPDVKEYGRLFSYGFIYGINLLGICLALIVTPEIKGSSFWGPLWTETKSAYTTIGTTVQRWIAR